MTAVTTSSSSPNQNLNNNKTVITDLRIRTVRKTKALEDSDGSSSEDIETNSPKSVVLRRKKVKNINVDVLGRRVRNQIERIRAEDSHLGEDIGECLIVKICGASHDQEDEQDVLNFSRPASPLSGKGSGRMM